MKTGHILMLVGAAAVTTGVVLHFRNKKKNDEAMAASGKISGYKSQPKAMAGSMQTYTCPQTGETITTNNYQEFTNFQSACQRSGGKIDPSYFAGSTVTAQRLTRR